MKNRLIFILCVMVSGCVTTQGSRADYKHNEAVMGHIRFMEKVNGRGDCDTEVLKVVDRGEEAMAYVEFWHVESCGVESIYKVRKAPLGGGQYKYSVNYPSELDMLRYKKEQE